MLLYCVSIGITTIQKNGGTLITENDKYKEGKISQYYLIRL